MGDSELGRHLLAVLLALSVGHHVAGKDGSGAAEEAPHAPLLALRVARLLEFSIPESIRIRNAFVTCGHT